MLQRIEAHLFLRVRPKGQNYARSVYAAGFIFNKGKFNGICYIGTKPTLKTKKITHIEAHIFNFHKNIYGKYLEIQFIKKIRKEEKFNSLTALTWQIKKDITSLKN